MIEEAIVNDDNFLPFDDGFDFDSLFGSKKNKKVNQAYVFYRLKTVNSIGEATIQFSQDLVWEEMNKELVSKTGHAFSIQRSHDYIDMLKEELLNDTRDLNITDYTLWYTDTDSITFKLEFANVYEVSMGGLDFEDTLVALVEQKEMYKFAPVYQYNA